MKKETNPKIYKAQKLSNTNMFPGNRKIAGCFNFSGNFVNVNNPGGSDGCNFYFFR